MMHHAICKPDWEIVAIHLVASRNLVFDALCSPVPPSPCTPAVCPTCSIIPCMPDQTIPQKNSQDKYDSDKPLSFPTSETDTPSSKRLVPPLEYDSLDRFLDRPTTLDSLMEFHAYTPENRAETSEEEDNKEIGLEGDLEVLERRKKDARNAKAHVKRAAAKRAREVADEGMAEDGGSEVEEPPRKKKPKKNTKKKQNPLNIFNSDDDDAEEPANASLSKLPAMSTSSPLKA
ncbi:hypothetical protein PILCRDRAFT_801265 [Piloderma croceum F 1598]|uniref:Uncharacterized protein n=1 Tax=Piloderma croceum (strain F 1598) TaxID=765440 RepID=A0A0C3F2Y7_PILCF|nr:hypothetical protein PILCRDRAFT_801265 [Piloderma croceum F 1598]